MKRRLIREFMTFGVSSSLSKFSMVLLLPIYLSQLSLIEYGKFEFIVMISMIMSGVFRFALPTTLSRFYFRSDFNCQTIYLIFVFFSTTLLSLINILVFYFDISKSFPFEINNQLLLLTSLVAYITAINNIMQMQLRMEDQVNKYFYSIAIQVLSNLMGGLILSYYELLTVRTIISISLISLLFSLVYLIVNLNFSSNNKSFVKNLKEYFIFAAKFFPATFGNLLSNNIMKFLIVSTFGASSFAVYSLAVRFVSIVQFLTDAVIKVWQRIAMENIEKENNSIYQSALSSSIKTSLGIQILVIFSVTLISMIDEVPLSYQLSIELVPILVSAHCIKALMNITQVGLIQKGKTEVISILTYSMSVVTVLLFYVVTKYFDSFVYIAIVICLSEVLFIVSLTKLSNIYSNIKLNLRELILYFLLFMSINLLYAISI